MNNVQLQPLSQNFAASDDPKEIQLNQEFELADWLMAVNRHARQNSAESLNTLFLYAQNLPPYDSMPQETQDIIKEIKEIAASNVWDPRLSPNSAIALQVVCQKSNLNSKPSYSRKLNF